MAFGWDLPTFAHIPLIHGPDGAKLSKRHGAQAVGDYQSLGYLPEAMRNYLARLGWSHGDDEIFDDAQAIEWFDVSGINKAPARLDFAKLGSVNAHWIRLADDARLVNLVMTELIATGHKEAPDTRKILTRTLPLVKERAQTIVQLAQAVQFAVAKGPVPLDEKTKTLLTEETILRLNRLHENVLLWDNWDADYIDGQLKKFVENEGVGFGKIGPVLRGILSAGHPAPDISRLLASIGREESLVRLTGGLFI
jgi:glutamyl-tRNA synthetase